MKFFNPEVLNATLLPLAFYLITRNDN